jgi:ABC-2 type transport system ATP-binding protein
MNPIIIENLRKSYGTTTAVNGVSFEVNPGEIFGLIGPDGAGKTTIIRTVVSLLEPDEGSVMFKGKTVGEYTSFVRSNIGYMPQRFSLYRDLTVDENLRFFGDLFKVPRSEQKSLMDKLYRFSKLEPFKNRRADALSGGMKQKLALSCMLMHQPEVIVLDEPTFGVDPVSRNEFWEILKTLADEGTTILVSTAYMDEAGKCDRVALMFKGDILALDEPGKLRQSYTDPLYLIETDDAHSVYKKIEQSADCDHCTLFGNGIHITDTAAIGEDKIRENLEKLQIEYKSFRKIEPELEDLFLKLIQNSVVEPKAETAA